MGVFFQEGGYDIFIEATTDWWGDRIIRIDMTDSNLNSIPVTGILFTAIKLVLILLGVFGPFLIWDSVSKTEVFEQFTVTVAMLIPAFIMLMSGKGTLVSGMVFMTLSFAAACLFTDKILIDKVFPWGSPMVAEMSVGRIIGVLFVGAMASALPSLIVSYMNAFLQKQKKEMNNAFSAGSASRVILLIVLGILLFAIWYFCRYFGIIYNKLYMMGIYYVNQSVKANNWFPLITIYGKYVTLLIPVILLLLAASGRVYPVAAFSGWFMIDRIMFTVVNSTGLNFNVIMTIVLPLICLILLLISDRINRLIRSN